MVRVKLRDSRMPVTEISIAKLSFHVKRTAGRGLAEESHLQRKPSRRRLEARSQTQTSGDAYEGRTTCEKCIQLYSQCFLRSRIECGNYDHDIDGCDDSADDQQDEGYLEGNRWQLILPAFDTKGYPRRLPQ
jgi:hypothetical protein